MTVRHIHVHVHDAFEESQHPRGEGGKFSTTVTKGKHYLESHRISGKKEPVKAQHYEVHHGGEHIGSVSTYGASQTKRQGPRSISTGRTILRWAAEPKQVAGQPHRRGELGFTAKGHAVEHLVRSYGKK